MVNDLVNKESCDLAVAGNLGAGQWGHAAAAPGGEGESGQFWLATSELGRVCWRSKVTRGL